MQYIDGALQMPSVLTCLAWFNYAKSIHGCLHRPTFDNNRATKSTRNGPTSFEFSALYFAVLGLGACITGETDRCKQYVQASWGYIAPRIFTSQSLVTVQAAYLLVFPYRSLLISKSFLLVLLGRYGIAYSVLGHAIRCIISSGQADFRLSYSHGLHRSANVLRQDGVPLNMVEIEERRRTFWGIYYLETVLSFILGRPLTISDSDVDAEMPLHIPDARITVDAILPEEIEAQAEDYLYEPLRSMCEQLRKISRDLYGPNASKERHSTDLANTIGSVGGDLAGWRASLPPENRPFKSAEDPANFVGAGPEQFHFSLAYYYCQCLIHRPALVEAMQRPLSDVPHGSVPQRSPRRGRSPVKQYINPKAQLTRPLNEELEGYAGRTAVAARDLLNLIRTTGFVSTNNQPSFFVLSVTN